MSKNFVLGVEFLNEIFSGLGVSSGGGGRGMVTGQGDTCISSTIRLI